MYCIVVDGIVNDPLVTKVVGTTTNGKTASATPVNSCWYLILANLDMVDSWKTVEARKRQHAPFSNHMGPLGYLLMFD